MNSPSIPQTNTADHVLAARADERLAHAYEQIARADEQLARVTEKLSRLENDGARRSSDRPGLRPSRGRPLLRGLTGLVLAAGICAAAFAAQSRYGEPARLMVAQWAPAFFSTALVQSGRPESSAQPLQPSIQLAAAETISSQPAPSLQAPAQNVAPAPLAPELTQLLQTMAHDISVVEQGIEELKASQERMFADTGRAIEQLKASQDQLTRVAARPAENKPAERPSEQGLRARTPALAAPSPTVANAARKPPPTQPPQARARPQPMQLQPGDH